MPTLPDPHAQCKPEPSEPNLRDFSRETGGLFRLVIYDMRGVIDCALAAELGDPLAVSVLHGICDFKHKVKKLKRPVCLCCNFTFFPKRQPAAIAIGLPLATSVAATMLLSGVCAECFSKGHEFIFERAVEHGRTLWPDLRLVDRANVGHEAGRA